MEKVKPGGFVSLFSTPFRGGSSHFTDQRMMKLEGRYCQGILSNSPPQKQDPLDLVPKDHNPMAFESLPCW